MSHRGTHFTGAISSWDTTWKVSEYAVNPELLVAKEAQDDSLVGQHLEEDCVGSVPSSS